MHSRTLDVAIVQAGEMTDDIGDNLTRLAALIRRAAEPHAEGRSPDLVVLPELITTPYFCTDRSPDRSGWADTVPGQTTDLFGGLARELGCAIAFGMFERAANTVTHNSVVLLDHTGAVVGWNTVDGGEVPAYRKLSLPASSVSGVEIDEKFHFAPGQAPVTVDALDTRFGCVICYDRTFPEYWAVARSLGAEVMLAIISSLGSRESLFVAELQTRALETQTWIIAANRGGPETLNGVTVDYFGLSCVISPTGEIVAQAAAHSAGDILRLTLDLDAVAATRAAFPLARDRRPEVVRLFADLAAGIVRPTPSSAPIAATAPVSG